jgi:uncharacterized protein
LEYILMPVGPQTFARTGDGHPLTTKLVADPRTPRANVWEQIAVRNFQRRMLDNEEPFPCIFGVAALREATLRYAFVSRNRDRVSQLAAALRDFVHLAPSLGRRTSLVTFFENGPTRQTLREYRTEFWALLQQAHDLDVEPWPPGIALDPEHENWEFSFAGMPMFVVVNTPAHRDRVSRHFDCLMVTFQPRFVFADLAADSRQGRNARTIIRKRLASYDRVPASPLLGSFGAPGNREWLQYFLDDDNTGTTPESARCPLHINRKEQGRQ